MSDAGPPHADALSTILLTALQALAASGRADEACRLAGRACAALRLRDAQQWKKFNAFLHRAARDTPDPGRSVVAEG